MRTGLIAAIAVLASGAARADNDCDAVFAAQTALVKVPYAATSTLVIPGQPTTHAESIVVGGKVYKRSDDKWSVEPFQAEDMLRSLTEYRQQAKMTCKKSGSAVIGGQPATLYRIHEDKPGNPSDSQAWLSDATGWVLKIELRSEKMPYTHTIEYRYDNIVPPPDVK